MSRGFTLNFKGTLEKVKIRSCSYASIVYRRNGGEAPRILGFTNRISDGETTGANFSEKHIDRLSSV
jgi:hypothetical protein